MCYVRVVPYDASTCVLVHVTKDHSLFFLYTDVLHCLGYDKRVFDQDLDVPHLIPGVEVNGFYDRFLRRLAGGYVSETAVRRLLDGREHPRGAAPFREWLDRYLCGDVATLAEPEMPPCRLCTLELGWTTYDWWEGRHAAKRKERLCPFQRLGGRRRETQCSRYVHHCRWKEVVDVTVGSLLRERETGFRPVRATPAVPPPPREHTVSVVPFDDETCVLVYERPDGEVYLLSTDVVYCAEEDPDVRRAWVRSMDGWQRDGLRLELGYKLETDGLLDRSEQRRFADVAGSEKFLKGTYLDAPGVRRYLDRRKGGGSERFRRWLDAGMREPVDRFRLLRGSTPCRVCHESLRRTTLGWWIDQWSRPERDCPYNYQPRLDRPWCTLGYLCAVVVRQERLLQNDPRLYTALPDRIKVKFRLTGDPEHESRVEHDAFRNGMYLSRCRWAAE